MEDEEKEQMYTTEEIEKITEVCMSFYGTNTRNTKRYRYAPAYILLLNTGMRVGELAALSWKDVDYDRKIIRISKRNGYQIRLCYRGKRRKSNVGTCIGTDI